MTFLDREDSNYRGRPIMLYEFRRGGLRLLYAGADRDVIAGDDTYVATAMSDGGFSQKGTAATDLFKITAPFTSEIASWFRYTPPSDQVFIIVRRFHEGDPETVIAWIGTVVSVGSEEIGQATLNCQAASISLKRTGLRLAWQRGCPHSIYDQNCRVVKSTVAVTRTVLSFSAAGLIVAPFSTTPQWAGGFLEWSLGFGTFERRTIEWASAAAGQIVPYGQRDGYTTGMEITLYPGCKLTGTHCESFFNNLANYGGFEFMPMRSPYDGDPVF